MMATIQVVMDDDLLRRLDCELDGAARARSAFIRAAVDAELRRKHQVRLEEQDRRAYEDFPITDEERKEAAAWQSMQDWGEPWDPKPS